MRLAVTPPASGPREPRHRQMMEERYKMRKLSGIRSLHVLPLLAALAFAGCATSGPATRVAVGSGPIAMRAGDFMFEPRDLQVKGTGTLTLRITNESGTPHDFTLKDPAGRVITKVELPANQTTTATVDLPAPGIYKFDCTKPLHAALGMTGRIVVTS